MTPEFELLHRRQRGAESADQRDIRRYWRSRRYPGRGEFRRGPWQIGIPGTLGVGVSPPPLHLGNPRKEWGES